MIPSRRWPGFTRWFAARAESRMRRIFCRVMIAGLDDVSAAARLAPTLWVANHTSWWDPLVAIVLGVRAGLDVHAMMAAENLERLPFFGLVGAFGVRRGDRRDGAAATRYAASLLDRPRRAVWIFPQGESRPAFEPLQFHGGATSIHAVASGAVIVPVGLRYVLRDDPRPELWIALGTPRTGLPRGTQGTATLTQDVAACLLRIDTALAESATADFVALLPTAPEVEGWTTRLLAGFARWIVRLRGRRLEAAVGGDPQRAIGPADLAGGEHPQPRPQQREVGSPAVDVQPGA